jgi:putative hydrolase of HD superfamily
MALVHDMAESIVGDITPAMNVPKQEKQAKERAAMEHMVTLLPTSSGAEIQALWEEYESQETVASQFVRDLDLLEMVSQAHQYEKSQPQLPPGTFDTFFSVTPRIQHPWARSLADRMCETRVRPGQQA